MQLRELRAYATHRRLPIAKFERSLISARARAGIAKARARGTRHGRPGLDARLVEEIRTLRRPGQSLKRIARQLGISHQTVANYASPAKDKKRRR